jgi:hypothetical protein
VIYAGGSSIRLPVRASHGTTGKKAAATDLPSSANML